MQSKDQLQQNSPGAFACTAFSIVLFILVLVVGNLVTPSGIAQALGICAGFALASRQLLSISSSNRVNMVYWVALLLGVIIACFYFLNSVLATYVTGCILLTVVFILSFSEKNGGVRIHALLSGIALVIVVALVSTPVTVSRVVVRLENLPVPSKFQLHSDPGSRIRHQASESISTHSFDPVEVHLSANNFGPGDPPPWLQLEARRATRFSVDWIDYRFLHIGIDRLEGDRLRQLVLSNKSDDVLYAPTERGIKVEDISSGESAWFQLPQPAPTGTPALLWAKVGAMKAVIWLLVCLGFYVWVPTRENENGF